jgi:hypothetical protein
LKKIELILVQVKDPKVWDAVEELEERLHGCISENGSATDIATEEMRENQ